MLHATHPNSIPTYRTFTAALNFMTKACEWVFHVVDSNYNLQTMLSDCEISSSLATFSMAELKSKDNFACREQSSSLYLDRSSLALHNNSFILVTTVVRKRSVYPTTNEWPCCQQTECDPLVNPLRKSWPFFRPIVSSMNESDEIE